MAVIRPQISLPGLFRLAKNVSKHSDYKIQMGAVLVRKGTPISVGFNKNKTHPSCKYSIHAEIDALRTSGKETIKNSTMYIYRENNDGLPALARPCDDCLKALTDFGVGCIIYTTNEYPYFRVEEI